MNEVPVKYCNGVKKRQYRNRVGANGESRRRRLGKGLGEGQLLHMQIE